MRRSNRNSKMWEYLESAGVLEKGSEEEIKAAKRRYRKNYFLEFKRESRKTKPEFCISFSKKNGEFDRVAQAAHTHKRTITAFIRLATLAYIEQRFVVPNPMQVAGLEFLLSQCLNEIKTLVAQRTRAFWNTEQKIEAIEKRIMKLETDINELFRNPQPLP